MELGQRLHARRRELKLSLRELAERAGVTASFLSQIEHDQASPSIESLRKISQALDVPIFYFLMEQDEKGPVVRRGRRVKLTLPHSPVTYELLCPDLSQRMEAFLAERQPGERVPVLALGQYTEEFIYVLEGQMEICLGDQTYTLMQGDTIYFPGPMLSSITASGDSTLRFISVITPPVF